jgi:GNAT superfamily N-acetyltransferase
LNAAAEIRPVRRADFPAWQKLWDGYNAFYGRSGATALAPESTQLTWSRFFDADEPMHALVAETSAGIVGLAHFLYHRSTTQSQPICYLSDLFTIETVRGQGVGGTLIRAVYEHAKRAGSQRVYWQTHETNAVARRLYDSLAERSGFIVYRHSL